jgi:hypothetical protein
MKTASYHILGHGRRVVNIDIIDAGRRTPIAEHPVEGKREARLIAAQYDAQPWNF